MPQPSSPQVRQAAGGAGAAAAATVVVPAGGAAVAGTPGLLTSAGAAAGAATIVATLITFLAVLRERHRAWLTRELGRYSKQPDDITQAVQGEMALEDEFARNSADRVASAMPQALRIADPRERERRVRQILADEERFAAQRTEAMAARAIAAVERSQLRRDSPLGAFWQIGVAKNHTAGCVFMAGKFWPWEVLDRVFPPRHYGCTSSLHGYGEAVLKGWMTPGGVPNTEDAIRAAAGVVMEAETADELLEAFDEGKHPRDWKGKFRKVAEVGAATADRSMAWRRLFGYDMDARLIGGGMRTVISGTFDGRRTRLVVQDGKIVEGAHEPAAFAALGAVRAGVEVRVPGVWAGVASLDNPTSACATFLAVLDPLTASFEGDTVAIQTLPRPTGGEDGATQALPVAE